LPVAGRRHNGPGSKWAYSRNKIVMTKGTHQNAVFLHRNCFETLKQGQRKSRVAFTIGGAEWMEPS
jgi:hypothetical protein